MDIAANWIRDNSRFAKDKNEDDPIPDHAAESSLYRHEIEILLQERTDMGLEKLTQAELESILAGLLGALEAARGTSLGLLDTMPSLSLLRKSKPATATAAAAKWVSTNCHCLSRPK